MTVMNHPYEAFQGDPLWEVVRKAIRDLAENGDLCEQTAREYIVGYVVRCIREFGKGQK